MSTALSFLLLCGGAYAFDMLMPDNDAGVYDVWLHHRPLHTQLANAFFFYGGVYGACNFAYHLFGYRRLRRALARKSPHHRPSPEFLRLVRPRIWELSSAARALATTGALVILAGLFGVVGECLNAARGIALTGGSSSTEYLRWVAADALRYAANGMFVAILCAFGFYILREGAQDATRQLDALRSVR